MDGVDDGLEQREVYADDADTGADHDTVEARPAQDFTDPGCGSLSGIRKVQLGLETCFAEALLVEIEATG